MWHRTYGGNATPSLEQPYPLKPGTVILGSGKCFICGMVTDLPHIGGTCQATEPLQPLESRWRQLVAGMLRRATFPRPPVSQVQYVWPAIYSGQDGYSASTPLPVQMITPYNKGPYYGSAGWDNGDYTDTTWDWTTASENGKGLWHQVDQQ